MYFSTQELEARGWTKSLIKKFLPKPDSIKNFRYGCQYFYGHLHVGEIEALDEFKQLQQKALRRRESGIAAAEKRKLEYLDYLKNKMPVRVQPVELDKLLLDAIESYNAHRARRWERRNWDEDFYSPPATKDSDESFLQRITVNYIRHNLTRYDALLSSQKGKMAKQDAIEIVQRRVFEAIIGTYPEYRDECERQMIDKGLMKKFIAEENGQLRLFA
jgi:hypothetical protein